MLPLASRMAYCGPPGLGLGARISSPAASKRPSPSAGGICIIGGEVGSGNSGRRRGLRLLAASDVLKTVDFAHRRPPGRAGIPSRAV